ncbi:MAG: SDR family NAD(P)-dependent oxidoreductase [Desulfobacterales bacterium]
MELAGKTALVLGGIKGIGKAVGLELARRGLRLGLTYYDWEDSLGDMQLDFAETGVPHLIERVNLLETESIAPFVRRVSDHFGRIDILINNIERGGWPVVHGPYTRDQWDLEVATTLRAKQWVLEAALPYLKETGDGCVINFSSIASIVGRSGPASLVFNEGYAAASRGVSLLTETWARLGAPEVRVNELMLGIFETRHAHGTRGWGLLSQAQKQAIVDHTLVGRIGRLEDVVKAVLFIIKDAPYMTGSVLRIDGGYVLGGEPVAPMPEGVE